LLGSGINMGPTKDVSICTRALVAAAASAVISRLDVEPTCQSTAADGRRSTGEPYDTAETPPDITLPSAVAHVPDFIVASY